MNEECLTCSFYYEEKENNWRECKHPSYDREKDICPGWLSKADFVGRQYDHDKEDR